MPENNDDPSTKVIPFGRVIPWTIAEELRKYYHSLLSEALPEDLSTLAQQLAAKLANEKKKS